ncbi:MAG: PilZ domain-containing protein [Tepidisphaerales bacterium]
MAESNTEILSAAVARNGGAVLSVPSADALRHMKTRFLGQETDSLWLEADEAAGGLLDTVAREGHRVGVVFKTGTRKIMFATRVLERRREYRINSLVTVQAVRVSWPDEIKSVQRRTNYRVKITADSELAIRAWRIPDQFDLRDKPPAAMELCVEAKDLSVGGISVLVVSPGSGSGRPIVERQKLRIQLHHMQSEVVLEAYVRHAVDTPRGQRLGVQFVNMEADLAGRQTVAKVNAIVAALARDEVRQLRLTS